MNNKVETGKPLTRQEIIERVQERRERLDYRLKVLPWEIKVAKERSVFISEIVAENIREGRG